MQRSEDLKMAVICKVDGSLLSLVVDSIGDVIEIPDSDFEHVPECVQGSIVQYLGGVYKTKDFILSIVDLDKLAEQINKSIAA